MQTIQNTAFLRFVLFADAFTSTVAALLMTVGGTFLASQTGLPRELLLYAGISLFPFAALLVYLATRKTMSASAIWLVITINFIWTLDSFLLLASGWVEPNSFGVIFVISQAIGVAVYTVLDYIALRNAPRLQDNAVMPAPANH